MLELAVLNGVQVIVLTTHDRANRYGSESGNAEEAFPLALLDEREPIEEFWRGRHPRCHRRGKARIK
jgi:hypothetical protein